MTEMLEPKGSYEGPDIEAVDNLNKDGDWPFMVDHDPLIPVKYFGGDQSNQKLKLFPDDYLILAHKRQPIWLLITS